MDFLKKCSHNYHLIWSSDHPVKPAEQKWASSLCEKAGAQRFYLLSFWWQSWGTAPVGLESRHPKCVQRVTLRSRELVSLNTEELRKFLEFMTQTKKSPEGGLDNIYGQLPHFTDKIKFDWMAQNYLSNSCKNLFSQLSAPCYFPPTVTFLSI